MSGEYDFVAEAQLTMSCASCGKSELDDIKLMDCDGCDLVRYCSGECKEDHQTKHEGKCKERAAELRDEILFKQPESSHEGDCPICCVPLPFEGDKKRLNSCCGKIICNGCSTANEIRQFQQNMQITCPFCRHPPPTTQEEFDKKLMERVSANDPNALCKLGHIYCKKGDYDGAFKYWTKAADLGDANAHYNLSVLYSEGQGVEKDEKKKIFHLEEAAIAGHPSARYNLANHEGRNKKFDRAVQHWLIGANLGHDKSLQELKACYKDGVISKEDFASALRAHHDAVNAMKSPQREAAERVSEK